ncbi:MAG: hypothetical protein H6632_16515 [Anaerolineales bacterium]|nr:hypothetical protein [Anaerolineales bacterium]
MQLTMDLESSAEILGTSPEDFLEFAAREKLEGLIKLNGDWRVSIFTLAKLLNTSPEILLELLEDYALGQFLDDVEADEFFEAEAGSQIYQSYLSESQQ